MHNINNSNNNKVHGNGGVKNDCYICLTEGFSRKQRNNTHKNKHKRIVLEKGCSPVFLCTHIISSFFVSSFFFFFPFLSYTPALSCFLVIVRGQEQLNTQLFFLLMETVGPACGVMAIGINTVVDAVKVILNDTTSQSFLADNDNNPCKEPRPQQRDDYTQSLCTQEMASSAMEQANLVTLDVRVGEEAHGQRTDNARHAVHRADIKRVINVEAEANDFDAEESSQAKHNAHDKGLVRVDVASHGGDAGETYELIIFWMCLFCVRGH